MKSFLIAAILSAAWIALLQTDIPTGKGFMPALGQFLHPWQGVWQSVKPTVPDQITDKHLSGNIRILFDERDVPHIYADNLEDALFAQGFLHASNRLFQMEVSARATGGHLSKWLGTRTLAFDKQRREIGIDWMAERKVKGWKKDPAMLSAMESYIHGVNSVISEMSYQDWPIEYKILNQQPNEWSLQESALIGISMSISLCYGEKDLEFTKALQKLTPEQFQFYYPDQNPLESPVISSNGSVSSTSESSPLPVNMKLIENPKGNEDVPLNGSNNWAVHGSRTTNGFPLLANDPHLNLTLPSIWYEMEIHTPQMHVHGVSIPGIPFIIIGFNEDIAWGSTNSGQDVRDWYHITWQDKNKTKYLLDGKEEDVVLRHESIEVRGQYPVNDTVRYTHFGPVSTQPGYEDMAVKWLPFAEAELEDIKYPSMIDVAKNFDLYSLAVAAFPYPSQNKVLATRDGDVAMRVSGLIPIRNPGTGESFQEGNTKANDWKGYIPFEQAPAERNPARGYVSSANQRPSPQDYPYPQLGRMYFEDYRGRATNMYLDSFQKASVADMKTMQQSAYNIQAAELLPALLSGLEGCNSSGSEIASRLSKWNYVFDKDSTSAVYYHIWYNLFRESVYDELDSLGLMYPEAWRIVDIALHNQDSDVFDKLSTTDKKETFAEICCSSFQGMLDSLERIKPDDRKNWGTYKHSAINHIARLPGFGISYIPTSGGQHMLNAMSTSHGPSWRMIVEMSSPPKAWVNYPGGQSGNPASKHYSDMVDGFFKGEYYEIALKKDPGSWKPVHETKLSPR